MRTQTFSPRERVLAALNHQEPDRVPTALWGSWYGVTDKLYFNVLAELGWEAVVPFRPELIHSVNHYDDRILEQLQVDVRHVDPGATAATSRRNRKGVDGWGLRWDAGGLYRVANYHPLEKATLDDILEYPLPLADETIAVERIRDRLEDIQTMGQEYAVVGRAVASYGLFEMAQSLRKHEQLLMDLALNPELVHALVSRLFECYAAMLNRFLEVAGPHLDMIELPGDDFAGNQQPIISPKMFDEFFKEPYRRLVALIKERHPNLKVVYHSDGAMTPFLPRLVEIGVDVFHPLEPLPATDMAAVKAEFGDRLTFLGGIDIREALQGDPPCVIEEVKNRLRQLGPGGGYILAPANHLQWDVPPQNLFTLFTAAREYGRYPLNL